MTYFALREGRLLSVNNEEVRVKRQIILYKNTVNNLYLPTRHVMVSKKISFIIMISISNLFKY